LKIQRQLQIEWRGFLRSVSGLASYCDARLQCATWQPFGGLRGAQGGRTIACVDWSFMRALRIKSSKKSLLTVERSKQWNRRMVYILVANKTYKYKNGRSPIVYIGTTGKGAGRPATSAVDKASEAFADLHGVKRIEVYIVTCSRRKAMKTWLHLESALLYTFRNLYFELPTYNKKKGSAKHTKDRFFRRSALENVILQFAL
jgi:hypothetical protein